jgi:hypothetical protein
MVLLSSKLVWGAPLRLFSHRLLMVAVRFSLFGEAGFSKVDMGVALSEEHWPVSPTGKSGSYSSECLVKRLFSGKTISFSLLLGFLEVTE